MNRSEQINELATALSKAQLQFSTLKRSGKNPQFSSRYSTFDDVMDAVRKPLADNGLAFSQMFDNLDGAPALTSILMHESGQWQSGTVPIVTVKSRVSSTGKVANNEVQMFGISSSYTKRYAVIAMLGVGGEEDTDGNAPENPNQRTEKQAPPMTKKEFDSTPAIDPTAVTEFLQVDRVGCVLNKAGDKPHLGLFEQNMKWPTFHYWKGRDAFLELCPWVGEIATKEQLGEPDVVYPFSAKVYYTLNEKQYKVVQRIERITTA